MEFAICHADRNLMNINELNELNVKISCQREMTEIPRLKHS